MSTSRYMQASPFSYKSHDLYTSVAICNVFNVVFKYPCYYLLVCIVHAYMCWPVFTFMAFSQISYHSVIHVFYYPSTSSSGVVKTPIKWECCVICQARKNKMYIYNVYVQPRARYQMLVLGNTTLLKISCSFLKSPHDLLTLTQIS